MLAAADVPDMKNAVLALSVSPRRGGNCDHAAKRAAEALRSEGITVQTLALRDYTVLPCVACGHCSRHPDRPCPLRAKDSSGPLLDALAAAPGLLLTAPIYFYHLPAQFKALIDRAQPIWAAKEAGLSTPPPGRAAGVVLVAARPRGERLFEGSLLTLRFWLDLLGLDMAAPLTLYGLDGPAELAAHAEKSASITHYAHSLAQRIRAGTAPTRPTP